MRKPIRYFVVNDKTAVMHIFGFCRQTKLRNVPIRLFDDAEGLQRYAGRPLRLCRSCALELQKKK